MRCVVALCLAWSLPVSARRVLPGEQLSPLESLPDDYWGDDESFLGNASGTSRRLSAGKRGASLLWSGSRGSKETEKPSTKAIDYLVTGLPGLASGAYPHRQWSGHLTVDPKHGGNLFYWLFEAWEGAADPTTPLVIWLNGGPACTSMDGLFLENGPFKITDQGNLEVNSNTWAKQAHLLYIDQPVGTGLSYVSDLRTYPRNDGDVNRALLAFMDALQAVHTWLPGRKVFLTGESHAGHYLPSWAQALVARADKQKSSATKPPPNEVVVLGGVAIGNGWFDPMNQYDVSTYAHGHGLVSSGQSLELKQREKNCQAKLRSGSYMNGQCWDLLDDVIKQSGGPGKPKVLFYDVRQYARSTSAFPPHHDRVEKYLNRKEVRQALHASRTPHVFKECTDPPYNALKHQDGLGVTKELVALLDRQVPLLFFNGVFDMICNHVSGEFALEQLVWSGATAFKQALPSVWLGAGSTPAGYARSSGPLTVLNVLGSGHMVPLDKPAEALDMLNRFVRGKSFADAKGGAVGSRAKIVTEKDNDASLVPPVIRQLPTAGDGAVAVAFEHNSHDGSRKQHKRHQRRRQLDTSQEGGDESDDDKFDYDKGEDVDISRFTNPESRRLGSAASSSEHSVLRRVFVVTSSPGSFTATGTGSPIVVRGLTNGVAYTFSVQAEVEDGRGVRRSASSAGSEAVVPGCGAQLTEDLLSVEDPEPAQAPRSSSNQAADSGVSSSSFRSSISGDSGGGDLDLFDSIEENRSSSSSQGRSGCQHGVCALDGMLNADRCFCDVGYAGSACDKNENMPEEDEKSSDRGSSRATRRSRSLAPLSNQRTGNEWHGRRGGSAELSSSSSASSSKSETARGDEKGSSGVSFMTLMLSVAFAAFGGVAMGLMLANNSTKQGHRPPERFGGGELPSAYA